MPLEFLPLNPFHPTKRKIALIKEKEGKTTTTKTQEKERGEKLSVVIVTYHLCCHHLKKLIEVYSTCKIKLDDDYVYIDIKLKKNLNHPCQYLKSFFEFPPSWAQIQELS